MSRRIDSRGIGSADKPPWKQDEIIPSGAQWVEAFQFLSFRDLNYLNSLFDLVLCLVFMFWLLSVVAVHKCRHTSPESNSFFFAQVARDCPTGCAGNWSIESSGEPRWDVSLELQVGAFWRVMQAAKETREPMKNWSVMLVGRQGWCCCFCWCLRLLLLLFFPANHHQIRS